MCVKPPLPALPAGAATAAGATWTARASGSLNWRTIAASADGTKLAAVVFGGQIYTSTDSGVTWTAQAAITRVRLAYAPGYRMHTTL